MFRRIAPVSPSPSSVSNALLVCLKLVPLHHYVPACVLVFVLHCCRSSRCCLSSVWTVMSSTGVRLLPRTDSLIISAPRRPLSPAHPTIVSSLVNRPRHLASLLTNGNFKLCYHEFPATALRGRGMVSGRS